MNKITTLLISAALLAGGLTVSNAAQAEMKIAVIKSARLLQESPQYKRAQQQMQADFADRAKALETEAKKLGEDIDEFKRNQDVMSLSERNRMEKDINNRRVDFNYTERKFREDLQAREKELANTLMNQISSVIKDVASSGGYDLVLQDPVYASDAVDITDAILTRLESQ